MSSRGFVRRILAAEGGGAAPAGGQPPSGYDGIAVASDQSVGYLTVPDSNELNTLPIPSPN